MRRAELLSVAASDRFAGVGPVEGMRLEFRLKYVRNARSFRFEVGHGGEIAATHGEPFLITIPKMTSIWFSHELCLGRRIYSEPNAIGLDPKGTPAASRLGL